MSKLTSLKFLFMTNDFVGPQNACLGLAQELRRRGHQIFFCVTKGFFDKFSQYIFNTEGFLPLLLTTKTKPDDDESNHKDVLQFLVQKTLSYGFVFPLSPLEKVRRIPLVNLIKTTFEDKLRDFDSQLKQYLEQINPDLIVYDGEIIPPAILFWSKCPWVHLFCSNPIGLFDSDKLPPFLSESDPESWREFNLVLDECYFSLVRKTQRKLLIELGYPEFQGSNEVKFFIHSPYLNMYQYPKELDYDDRIQIPDKCFRVDAFCRDCEESCNSEEIQLLKKFRNRAIGNKLIYLSFGSMGSCNLELMQRLIQVLSRTDYFYLISKGIMGDQLELPSNMYGTRYLPQIFIFKNLQVDLAIIHGGNNSLTEALYFGIPCIVMPLFYDQFLNSQRVQEKRLGIGMDPFRFEDNELIQNIDQMLNDVELIKTVKKISQRIQKSYSKSKCCEKLERLIEEFKAL